ASPVVSTSPSSTILRAWSLTVLALRIIDDALRLLDHHADGGGCNRIAHIAIAHGSGHCCVGREQSLIESPQFRQHCRPAYSGRVNFLELIAWNASICNKGGCSSDRIAFGQPAFIDPLNFLFCHVLF